MWPFWFGGLLHEDPVPAPREKAQGCGCLRRDVVELRHAMEANCRVPVEILEQPELEAS